MLVVLIIVLMDIINYQLLNVHLVIYNVLLVKDQVVIVLLVYMDRLELMALVEKVVEKISLALEEYVLLVIRVAMDAVTYQLTVLNVLMAMSKLDLFVRGDVCLISSLIADLRNVSTAAQDVPLVQVTTTALHVITLLSPPEVESVPLAPILAHHVMAQVHALHVFPVSTISKVPAKPLAP